MDNDYKKKIDTISEKHFGPLETAEFCSRFLFYISAILSFTVPLTNKDLHPIIYNISQIVFLAVVVFFSAISLAAKLYFSPRAQVYRYKDFLSHAYNIPMSDEQTKGYYNNNQTIPSRRIAAQALENSFYSKDIILEMVKCERIKVVVYIFIWLIVIFNRSTDLALIAIAAQLVLSEQLLSRWLRIEWLRNKFEKTFDDLFRLFQNDSSGPGFEVNALEITGNYEMAKANSGITLPSKIFSQSSKRRDEKWKDIIKKLKL